MGLPFLSLVASPPRPPSTRRRAPPGDTACGQQGREALACPDPGLGPSQEGSP